MEISPIGIVKNEFSKPLGTSISHEEDPETWKDDVKANQKRVQETISELIINPEYNELLDGIEEFSHLLVLFWPHLVDPARRKLKKVHPMGRKDLPERGIFATCSPARPNPVLVTAVRLVARKDNVLQVTGLEAINGTPIIDIKPYSRNYHLVSDLKAPEWMQKLHRDTGVL